MTCVLNSLHTEVFLYNLLATLVSNGVVGVSVPADISLPECVCAF